MMIHAFHHLQWLLRRFRGSLFLYTGLWVATGAFAWLRAGGMMRQFPVNEALLGMHGLLGMVAILIVVRMVWENPAAGTGSFWRTRPPRGRALGLSQALFTALFLAGPPVLLWLINGLRLDLTPLQWRYGAMDLLYIFAPLAASAGIASFSRNWFSFAVVLTGAGACVAAGILLAGWPPVSDFGQRVPRDWRFPGAALAAAASPVFLVCWLAGLRSPGWHFRAAVTGSLLIAVSAWALMKASSVRRPGIIELPEPSFDAEGMAALHSAGNFPWHYLPWKLKGLPPGVEANIGEGGLNIARIHALEDRGQLELTDAERLHQWSRILDWRVDHARRERGFIPENTLRALFPPEVRWYTAEDVDERRVSTTLRFEASPVTFTMRGGMGGTLVAAKQLVSVPLEKGGSSAGNGTRVVLRDVRISGEHIRVEAGLWHASAGGDMVPPEGVVTLHGSLLPQFLPVLYLPALPAAILVSAGDPARSLGGTFCSWQCVSRQLTLHVSLPAAEGAAGRRFTPDVLRGAHLVLCAPVAAGYFRTKESRAVHEFSPAGIPEEEERRQLGDLFVRIHYTGWRAGAFERSAYLREAAAELVRRGIPAFREMLRRDWDDFAPLEYPGEFRKLWAGWQVEQVMPEITDAISRDERWLAVAATAGWTPQLANVALARVQKARTAQSRWTLAAAALAARPPDYAVLEHHVRLNGAQGMKEPKDLWADRDLWPRLRALPGFPWQAVARDLWQQVWIEDTVRLPADTEAPAGHEPLVTAAALAGSTTALNAVVEYEMPGMSSLLTPQEWEMLAGFIDGIPPAGEARKAWLQEKAGRFIWNETAGRYRVSE